MKIAIAGASGFVGKSLCEILKSENQVVGFSRADRKFEDIEWRQVDIFSYQSTCRGLEGVDVAIYLVHSMMPSTRLFQGNFQDTDLFLADNFARACEFSQVKHIIYLGGLVPKENVSKHLKSRKEVERIFFASAIPTTVLRAGMVTGFGGSSFEMLKNLVINLPVMILPRWTQSSTQTIYIDDLVSMIAATLNQDKYKGKIINAVNNEVLTYEKLILLTAIYFKRNFKYFRVPVNYTSISKLWVTIFGESDYSLVSPLIDSLKCDLGNIEEHTSLPEVIQYRSYEEMLRATPKKKFKRNANGRKEKTKTVRSIQRLDGIDLNEHQVGELYFHWLPKKLNGLIRAIEVNGDIQFKLFFISTPLLTLRKIEEVGDLRRVKFHIIGGLLTSTSDTGWLEFRSVKSEKCVLASINEFVPSLPWFIYKYTQALAHIYVMNSFRNFLQQRNNNLSKE